MPAFCVAKEKDLADGALRAVSAGGHRIALLRLGSTVHAIDDRCPHAGGPLSEGAVEGGLVRCPWHERRFDPRTGACADHERTRPVACYPTRVESGDVWVDLPD